MRLAFGRISCDASLRWEGVMTQPVLNPRADASNKELRHSFDRLLREYFSSEYAEERAAGRESHPQFHILTTGSDGSLSNPAR